MYFPIGWPKSLQGGRATRGHPVKVFRHKSRDLVVELRSHSVAFWHTRVSFHNTKPYFILINAHPPVVHPPFVV